MKCLYNTTRKKISGTEVRRTQDKIKDQAGIMVIIFGFMVFIYSVVSFWSNVLLTNTNPLSLSLSLNKQPENEPPSGSRSRPK